MLPLSPHLIDTVKVSLAFYRPYEYNLLVMQGMLRGEELSAAYASADIFMMPSETETLGFVALEAMASGLAVVAVAAGGLVDIVTKPGVIGELPCCTPSPFQVVHSRALMSSGWTKCRASSPRLLGRLHGQAPQK